MKGTDQYISISSSLADAGVGQNSLGIVSPCSTCTNYRSVDAEDGPACPRRFWQYRTDQLNDAQSFDDVPADYLVRKARDPEAAGLENPVQWPEGNCRVVWVAVLEENRAVVNADGTVAAPDLVTPGFDTNQIRCRQMPYIPAVREADYYAGAQLKERDFVFVQSIAIPQEDARSPGERLRIGGVCQKITPMQKAMVTPAKMSVNPRGM